MTTVRLYCKTIDDATDLIREVEQSVPEIAEEAMVGALVSTPFLMHIWEQTPKSERARYAEQMGVKVNWKNRAKMEKGWAEKVSPKQYERLQTYGNSNLAKSVLPWGQRAAASDLRSHVAYQKGRVSFVLSSDLVYAHRVHEMEGRKEWAPGEKHGWSTRGTHGHFIYGEPDSPVERDRAMLLRQVGRNILADIKRRSEE